MFKKLLTGIIKLYKKFVSPLFPASCRFYPSCSEYSITSIQRYGVFKGLILSVYRILRCNPFSKGGVNFPEEDARRIFR